ncbi:hypothetical protein CSC94_15120 [Zhengella mangrovi]|uniref:histidine kinase n=2 Tax=Zhengella mangrovi TaxID=1982044 RepID=A0A2G1QM76_9HYPH|nr:hypothetical protein CSC94_15120 [Zhengella mangrovi]
MAADPSPQADAMPETTVREQSPEMEAPAALAGTKPVPGTDTDSLPFDTMDDAPNGSAASAAGENAEPVDQAEDETEAPTGDADDAVPPSEAVTVDEASLPTHLAAGDVSPSFLARLPVPLLVTRNGRLAYANSAFLALSGHGSLADVEATGGLDALFGDAGPEGQELRLANGQTAHVRTHMQSVGWRGGKAILLAFLDHRVPAETHGPEATVAGDEPAARPVNAFQSSDVTSELQATVRQLNTILDTATDGIVLIENDGSIRAMNRSAQALFGYENDDMAGQAFTRLFAVESQRAAGDYLSGLADNGVASVLNDGREVIGRESRGRFIPLFMSVGRLPADGGFCAVMRDITNWKRVEEDLTEARRQAEEASSQKTQFLARVSHEIRTPLNAIIGFSELMLGERFGPIGNERYKDYLRDINRSGNHVLDLVNDLLDISKIEAGHQELSHEAVPLNDVLGEAVAIMQPQANRERVIIRSSLASGLPDIVADMRSVRQIALNLLSNAVKFTPPGGQVIVSTAYEPSGEVVMHVRDTGIGMTASDIEHAMKPFKQLNTMRRTRGDGTGLGLPLTKALVEANRARFAITSTPGEGTIVEVIFPPTRVLAD